MPYLLSKREPSLKELMDDPDANKAKLFQTYVSFHKINIISVWRKIYRRYLKPHCLKGQRRYSLLDIGFGGGDIPLALSRWVKEDGIALDITAIEVDKRAYEFIQMQAPNSPINFRLAHTKDVLGEGESFDFVISNNLLHHLGEEELLSLFNDARQLSKSIVLFNDIERGDLAYLFFGVIAPLLFKNSFIVHDGLISIRKSFTKPELKALAPADWKVTRLFPARLLLTYEVNR